MSKNFFKIIFKLLLIELKMIVRNRRPRHTLYMFLLTYLLICLLHIWGGSVDQIKLESNRLFFYAIYNLTSLFIWGHGMFWFCWESSFFLLLMTQPITFLQLLLAKIVLAGTSIAIFASFSLLLMNFYSFDVLMMLSLAIFNAGFTTFFVLLFSLYNNDRIDLNKGIFFNYEAYGVIQYNILLVIFLLPLLLFKMLTPAFSLLISKYIIAGVGLLFCLLSPIWIRWLSHLFYKRKYTMINSFITKEG